MQADLFTVDLSNATVITMFLLPTLNLALRSTLLTLAPGTRVVSNTFDMGEWEPDVRRTIGPTGCTNWCSAMLWIVPPRSRARGRRPGLLTVTQTFQMIAGSLGSTHHRKVIGDQITFTAAGAPSGREPTAQSGIKLDGRSRQLTVQYVHAYRSRVAHAAGQRTGPAGALFSRIAIACRRPSASRSSRSSEV